MPQGTATNNTSDEDAGLDSIDWFADASFAAEEAGGRAGGRGRPRFGQRRPPARGLPRARSRAVRAACRMPTRHDHAEAVAMNAALYPGTLGYFLRTMIGEVAGDATLDDLRDALHPCR